MAKSLMTQIFSFKTIRILCFGLLISLNLFGGAFFFFKLQNVSDNISASIVETRPFLDRVINLQKSTSELDLLLHKQISGQSIDNFASIQLIDAILPEIELLVKAKAFHSNEIQYLKSFSKELKRLKVALIYYRKSRIYDSTSSSTEELFEIIDESINKINHSLNSIITTFRRQIAESDDNVLTGIQYIQSRLKFYLMIILLGTLFIFSVFNIFLTANLKKLIDGTIKLGKGKLHWRIKNKFTDEFGRLTDAFNDMAGRLSNSQDKILAQTKKIEELAYYDPLTKLPNRTTFLNKLDQEMARAKRNNEKLGVLYIDLDDFKLINDSYGHDVGDFLLIGVAERLKKHTRLSDTVARLAGDEFTVILPQLNSYQDSAIIGQRILEKASCPFGLSQRIIEELSQPFEIYSNTLTISSSIGIAVYPDNGTTAQEILNSADTAMYSAKQAGKNRYKYCTEEMTLKSISLHQNEQDIRQALAYEEFVLHYQPLIDLATKNIIGLEALIRWNHPQRGLISPVDFIPIAEDRGIIHDISKWIIADVLKQHKLWKKTGCRMIPVTVNLSSRDFFQQGIEKYIFDLLKKDEQFRGFLGIEVTETTIMEDRENAIATLNRLKNIGVKIALDDFGTGYSSLNYLKLLPIDTVKIDRSFIKNIINDPKDASITESIISMSHSLNLKVLAEGVETPEQFEFLRSIHCDQAQGYLFSKPLPADEISKLLRESSEK